ncbi:unnamed protein product [Acanthoscelides obtectus]|uniref:Uncharacterized protein n=1 Tax=Acanthoscelides obtectus TaxID=200917 RepID=A0A9P0Q5T1_ACAOB|nr:unnamed protein product [Acanthoscelides obtectus]CAK1676947.1 Zinc finger BED domain-containing protein 5 [Acanthoscelides obtectus]
MALEASFRVSYRLARSGKAHTVAENFIGPCAKDIAILTSPPNCKLCSIAREDVLYAKPLETYTTGATMLEWTHCCIHRQAWACKRIPAELASTLSETVKVVNFIKSRETNFRLIREFGEDLGSLHVSLLLHTGVRWFSRGKILTCLFDLLLTLHFICRFCIRHSVAPKLAYLADLFSKLNKLNTSLQGPGITIFNVHDRIEAMLKKINFCNQCLSLLSENKIQLTENIKRDITEHLKQLQLTFKEYFPNKPGSNNWICNPF